ncbi:MULTISPECIES: hypothetical protein [Lysinibacillus]|uniref:hypothetical protein n=1 Tax=Lysinibacillus TaxID=400634 RepID=UPI0018CD9F38|nr:hypothetical protein [Lysinibacillus sphaericus]MBG9757297.1 hypothetical protein [Lysinibacillus sphaericus]QTB12945.1 hypothetical protein J2B92_19440 [Lysinibacillus sphaericus]
MSVIYKYNGNKIELSEEKGIKPGWQLIINGVKQDSIIFNSAFIGNTLKGKIDSDNVTVTINNKIIFYTSELFINGRSIEKRKFLW